MEENFPKFTCQGCQEAMRLERIRPLEGNLKEVVYVCPKCLTETTRLIVAD